LGSHKNKEGSIYLNPQSWSVISGAASQEQAQSAMDAVEKHLECDYGLALFAPAFGKLGPNPIYEGGLFNPGQKENASIFNHTQPWAVIADCILGNGNRAYKHYHAFMPSRFNDIAEIRQLEPYVHCQGTNSQFSPRCGSGGLPWLTGTVSWSYFAATQYILGIRPVYEGICIDPCIPANWQGFSVRRVFRGNILNIKVENPQGVQKGVKQIMLNGQEIEGNIIPANKLQKQNEIKVLLRENNK
jgi:N,N'-diacetylchitobiose phosphorylase